MLSASTRNHSPPQTPQLDRSVNLRLSFVDSVDPKRIFSKPDAACENWGAVQVGGVEEWKDEEMKRSNGIEANRGGSGSPRYDGGTSMMHQIRYGASSILQLDVPADALIADCTQIAGTLIEDPGTAAAAALLSPTNYPPLRQAVVPGDRVVVALDPDVPQAGQLVAGVVHALLEAAVEADHITVLQAQNRAYPAELSAQLPSNASQVQFAVHDPDDREHLAYLAASKDATPIVLNRLLCDADLVLPINLLRPESALLYSGPHGALCPTFADSNTQQRYRTPNSMATAKQQRRRRDEANEVAWLLGIQLTLQVVAGPGDSVLHVLAGLDEDVSRQGRALVRAAWQFNVAEKANLVVATIEGEHDCQSWDNFSRALHAAQQVCAKDGTIVLCTDLSCKPGPALKRLGTSEDKERLLQRLGNDRSADAISAWLLLDARDTSHVFLLSRLDEASVESLGIGYIDEPRQVNRISRQSDSCILLANAHRAVMSLGS